MYYSGFQLRYATEESFVNIQNYMLTFRIITQAPVTGLWFSSFASVHLTRASGAFFFFLIISTFYYYLFTYLFVCVGSSLLCEGFLQSRQAGATPHRGARASHHRGPPTIAGPPPRSTGSRHAGPAFVAHGPSHSAACGILPDQGWNPCPLH